MLAYIKADGSIWQQKYNEGELLSSFKIAYVKGDSDPFNITTKFVFLFKKSI